MLTLTQLKRDLYQMAGVDPDRTIRQDVQDAVRLAVLTGQQTFCLGGPMGFEWSFLEQYQSETYIVLQAPYETGTVAVTNLSKTLTGTGTVWTRDMVGTYFRVDGGETYEIASWTSATVMTLVIPFQGTTDTDATYKILRRYYPLPLDFLQVHGDEALLQQPNQTGESIIGFRKQSAFSAPLNVGGPQECWITGQTLGQDYYNTGTVLIATTSTVSTWTVSSGTLPTDIVDREVRITGEDRPYRINARLSATTFTTYQTYVNPTTLLATQLVASVYAITPKETLLIAFNNVPDQVYIFKMPYIRRLPELLLGTDISPISYAGYDRAFRAACRYELSQNGRLAMKADLVKNTEAYFIEAMASAWSVEQMNNSAEEAAENSDYPATQSPPSWFA